MTLLHTRVVDSATGCPVCGGPCKSFPDVPYPRTYPFLPGGYEPVPEPTVPAPEHIWINDILAFATGDPVPYDQAVKLGIVGKGKTTDPVHAEADETGTKPTKAAKAQKRAKKAASNRARTPGENRSK